MVDLSMKNINFTILKTSNSIQIKYYRERFINISTDPGWNSSIVNPIQILNVGCWNFAQLLFEKWNGARILILSHTNAHLSIKGEIYKIMFRVSLKLFHIFHLTPKEIDFWVHFRSIDHFLPFMHNVLLFLNKLGTIIKLCCLYLMGSLKMSLNIREGFAIQLIFLIDFDNVQPNDFIPIRKHP